MLETFTNQDTYSTATICVARVITFSFPQTVKVLRRVFCKMCFLEKKNVVALVPQEMQDVSAFPQLA